MEDLTTNAATRLGIVLVTAGSEPEAADLASYVVENHLAACVSITPIQSVYTWQGKIQHEREWQLVIKTDLNRFDDLSAAITQKHSYEVPEIIAIPIQQGLPAYLTWMAEQTQPLG
jgi:periplasmic divalent cation tolerance protein